MHEFSSTLYKRTELDVEKQLLVTLTYLGTVQSYKYALLLSIMVIIIYNVVNWHVLHGESLPFCLT